MYTLPTDPLFTRTDVTDRTSSPNHIQTNNIDYAWSEYNLHGAGQSILIVGTGGPTNHDTIDIKEGRSFSSDQSWQDLHSHETFISYMIGDNHDGELGAGIADEADIYIAKANEGSAGTYNTQALIDSVNWGIELGVDVINLSLSGFFNGPQDFKDVIVEALDLGIRVVASAGNAGREHIEPGWPANYDPRVDVVGSHTRFLTESNFSQNGDVVDILAVGQNVTGVFKNGDVGTWNGTSFSAPIVSGAILLAKEAIETGIVEAGTVIDQIYDYTLPVMDIPATGLAENGSLNLGFFLHDNDATGRTDPLIHIPQDLWGKTQDLTFSYLLPEQETSFGVKVFIETPDGTFDRDASGNYVPYQGGDHLISFDGLSAGTTYHGNLHGFGGINDKLQLDNATEGDHTAHVVIVGQGGIEQTDTFDFAIVA